MLTDITTNKYTMDNNNNKTKLIEQDHGGYRECVCNYILFCYGFPGIFEWLNSCCIHSFMQLSNHLI